VPNNICLWAAIIANLTRYRISNLRPAGRKSIWATPTDLEMAFKSYLPITPFLDHFRFANDTTGMWKVVWHFYVRCDYSVRMGIGQGARFLSILLSMRYARARPSKVIRDGRDTWLATSSPERRTPEACVDS
jgi:hypothetical protein